VVTLAKVISICCRTAQGGQGKNTSDSHVTFARLSHAAVNFGFTNRLCKCKWST